MKVKKVKTDTYTTNNVNIETGEILSVETEIKHHKIVVDDRENFVMMYASVIGLIDELDKVGVKLLVWCSSNCTMNSNLVNLSKPMCEEIGKTFDLKLQTIKNAIVKLKKKNVLLPVGSATYRVNPRYFWRGDAGNRKKYILEIDLNIDEHN